MRYGRSSTPEFATGSLLRRVLQTELFGLVRQRKYHWVRTIPMRASSELRTTWLDVRVMLTADNSSWVFAVMFKAYCKKEDGDDNHAIVTGRRPAWAFPSFFSCQRSYWTRWSRTMLGRFQSRSINKLKENNITLRSEFLAHVETTRLLTSRTAR